MCSVLLLHRVLPDAPLAVIFVRDEDLDRGGSPPELRPDLPRVLAPRDPLAGGTWFGMSGAGFLAGLVNRKGDPIPEDALSRGALLAAALGEGSAPAALERAAEEMREKPYGGCRVFAGNGEILGWVDLPVSGHPSAVHLLEPGSWLMRHNHHPEAAPPILLPAPGETVAPWLERATELIAEHQPTEDPLCHHGQRHGSVDTSLAALGPSGRPLHFRHLQGAPCSGDPEDFDAMLMALD